MVAHYAHYHRQQLRARYLAQQQAQLARDARLPDPAAAYEALLAELDEPDDARERQERAA